MTQLLEFLEYGSNPLNEIVPESKSFQGCKHEIMIYAFPISAVNRIPSIFSSLVYSSNSSKSLDAQIRKCRSADEYLEIGARNF